MTVSAGIVCGKCDRLNPIKSRECDECGNDLNLVDLSSKQSSKEKAKKEPAKTDEEKTERPQKAARQKPEGEPMEQARYYICSRCQEATNSAANAVHQSKKRSPRIPTFSVICRLRVRPNWYSSKGKEQTVFRTIWIRPSTSPAGLTDLYSFQKISGFRQSTQTSCMTKAS